MLVPEVIIFPAPYGARLHNWTATFARHQGGVETLKITSLGGCGRVSVFVRACVSTVSAGGCVFLCVVG